MMRKAFNIKILSYLLAVFLLILPQKGKTQNALNDIRFKSKDNGIIVEFEFENTISADSIYSWQSDMIGFISHSIMLHPIHYL